MLYYVRTGSVDTTQYANSHKQAAVKTLKEFENFGMYVVVCVHHIDDDAQRGSQVFFHTDSLLDECGECDDKNLYKNNMRLIY